MIIKITPDIEKAKSILDLVKNREDFVKTSNRKFPTIIAETYYEIIKEFALALLLLEGLSAKGEYAHKDLIKYLRNYEFDENEIQTMNDLRIRRNNSQYEGKQIPIIYLENNEKDILNIISKLKNKISKKLK